MRILKKNWSKEKLESLCTITSGGTPSKSIGDYWTDGTIPWLRSECCKDEVVHKAEDYISEIGLRNSSAKVFKAETTLIALVGATIGKTAFLSFDSATNQNVCGLYPTNKEKLFPRFLFYACQAFYNHYFGGYSGFKMANQTFIKKLEIPLPSLEEQMQISTIFHLIEISIEHVEIQERSFKLLWLKLIDGFVNERPSFGNILMDKNLLTVTYGDVTEKLMRRIDPISYGIEKIVAGENLESEDFKIRTWQIVGEGYLGPAFHVLFKPGDILYGSRRTYLKKVAMANFEGVCANTTYVIRAKEKFLLQDLLKHIMLSDRFTKYSIGVSKGSTNPYINWKDLDNFTFQVPDIETQIKIAKVLDDVVNIIENLKAQQVQLRSLKQNLLNEILG